MYVLLTCPTGYMTSDNINYQKALETVANTYPPAKGFVSNSEVQTQGDKILIEQNNIIIELLIQNSKKLDSILSYISKPGSSKEATDISTIIDKINRNLESLYIKGKPVISKTSQEIAVWKDPKELFKNG